MEYYIYRFLNLKNEIIYVGKTQNIKSRMNAHFGNSGHLPQECYKQTIKIECAICESKTQMDIYEIYYINKFRPIYNTSDKNEEEDIAIQLPEKTWFIYNNNEKDYNNNIIQEYEEMFYQNEILKKENIELKESLRKINCEENQDKTKVPYSFELADIVDIYKVCKNETLEFYSQWVVNYELCHDIVIYYKDDKIYWKDRKNINTYEGIVYHDFIDKNHVHNSWYPPLYGTFYPSTKTGYLIQEKILKNKIDNLKSEMDKTYTIQDIIKDKDIHRYHLKSDTEEVSIIRSHDMQKFNINIRDNDMDGVTEEYLLNKFKNQLFIGNYAYDNKETLKKYSSKLLEISLELK